MYTRAHEIYRFVHVIEGYSRYFYNKFVFRTYDNDEDDSQGSGSRKSHTVPFVERTVLHAPDNR